MPAIATTAKYKLEKWMKRNNSKIKTGKNERYVHVGTHSGQTPSQKY